MKSHAQQRHHGKKLDQDFEKSAWESNQRIRKYFERFSKRVDLPSWQE